MTPIVVDTAGVSEAGTRRPGKIVSLDTLSHSLALSQAAAIVVAGIAAKIVYIDLILSQTHQPLFSYIVPGFALALIVDKVYRRMRLFGASVRAVPALDIGRAWTGLTLSFLVLLGGMYILKMAEGYSRGWFLFWLAFSAIAVVGVRAWFISRIHTLGRERRLGRRIAILGVDEGIAAIGPRVAHGFPQVSGVSVHRVRLREGAIVTALAELQSALNDADYEKVIVALPPHASSEIRQALRALAPYGTEVLLCTDWTPRLMPVHGTSTIGDLCCEIVGPVPEADQDWLEKHILDYTLAAIALVLLTPVFALIAIAIKLDSPGPVFFRQQRYGRHNRIFRIFKFRTMTVAEDGPVVTQACPNDARVTRVGRILRKTSIDELPQIINVLLGHMSLVGPRPHARAHEEKFERDFDLFSRRRRVLPGITGWAQVNGYRGETRTPDDVRHRMEHDLHYIDNWSIWLDLEIMVRTVVTVFRGAY